MQQPSWLAPAGVFRFFGRVRQAVAARLAETPIAFFAIVIGVALVFKVGIGFAKPSVEPDAPVVARLSSPKHRDLKVTPVADPAASPLPSGAVRANVLGAGTEQAAPSARPPRRHHRHSH